MKKLKRILLVLLVLQAAVAGFGLWLKTHYAAQQAGVDEVNAVAIMGGNQTKVTNQTFRGGYIRAVMGGVELDLRNAAIDLKPATIEATVVMGGVRILVPNDWTVDIRTQALMGGVADLRNQAEASSSPTADLIITGSSIMGGLAIANSSEDRHH